MSKQSGLGARFLVGGYDISGDVNALDSIGGTQALLDSALDPAKTTKELRGDIGKALNLTPEPDGTWFDWGGSFLTKEEKDFMKEAILVTIGLLGIKADVPESVQRKAVFKAWAEEFYATHSPEFYGVADGGGSAPAVLLTRGQDSGSGAKG